MTKILKLEKTKSWYKSKTIWLNVISIIVEILQQILDLKLLPSGTLLLIVNILNIILRTITKYPVKK